MKRHRHSSPSSTIRNNGTCIPRNYLDALYSCLVEFKPKKCLEIGTHMGDSTGIFQEYFDQHDPEGLVVTCDIQEYKNLSHLKNVKQLQVYPHIIDFSLHDFIRTDKLLPDYQQVYYNNQSVERNLNILKEFGPYDFVFIDGDHQAVSFYKDLEISLALLSENGKIFVDDTCEYHHDTYKIYNDVLKHTYNCYEFEDWDVAVGGALIWKK